MVFYIGVCVLCFSHDCYSKKIKPVILGALSVSLVIDSTLFLENVNTYSKKYFHYLLVEVLELYVDRVGLFTNDRLSSVRLVSTELATMVRRLYRYRRVALLGDCEPDFQASC